MLVNKFIYIYIRNTIAICKHKRFFSYVFLRSLYASACHCLKTCIQHCNSPWLCAHFMNLHIVVLHINRNVAITIVIVKKKVFYNMSFVSGKNNKVIKSVMAVDFHNMPENRVTADFYHRLRHTLSFFSEPSTKSACKYKCFHILILLLFFQENRTIFK